MQPHHTYSKLKFASFGKQNNLMLSNEEVVGSSGYALLNDVMTRVTDLRGYESKCSNRSHCPSHLHGKRGNAQKSSENLVFWCSEPETARI
jgi:hypothetical protein